MLVAALLATGMSACGGGASAVQCQQDGDCNLTSGGKCVASPSDHQWCAYPDPSCPEGYRYSTQSVGDGLSGDCVSNLGDAGVDAPTDAQVGDGNVSCKPRLVFNDGATGTREVWVTNPDGTGKQNVSNDASHDDWRPSWSPDGTKVVFESNRAGNFDIFVVNADGSGLKNLTQSNTGDDIHGVWSPDGTKIAYVAHSVPWVTNADGTGQAQVSTLTQVNDLAWSPDSTKIVFAHVNPSFPAQFVTAIVSGSPVQVSPTGSFTAPDAVWAPNNKIAFYGGGANFDVYTVNSDASGSFNVTQSAANEYTPHWTKDGTTLVFSSDKNGKVEIWKTSNTGGTQTEITTNNLTTSGTGDFTSDVSSDGKSVAFDRRTSSTASQVGVVGMDGANLVTFDAGGGNAQGAKFSSCP